MKSLKQMKAELAAVPEVQAEVAQRMGTTQSVVARLESGRRPPSLRTVQRYAQAVGARAVVRLEA
ncbi:helix-turn-helix transcriptional regulator [Thiomonas sp. FB-6]|uniref:helix-turn-helix domain-containing protein n=1 Tax=Thiomonas sp. FB-6 TaxID=1158291 RepID=UPI00036C7FF8|nr:helix-turn-helix transcriptional regulator [Thiomonas sp. FB-6]